MEAKLSSEAEMIYKKLGHQRYKSLVEDMRKIAEKFKERHNRYENIVKEPLTPSTGVNYSHMCNTLLQINYLILTM